MSKKYGKWNVGETLTEGGQGQIFPAWQDGEEQADKYILKKLKNKKRIGRFINEIRAGLELDHPYILKIVDSDFEHNPPYLVTEYLPQGNLADSQIHTLPVLKRLHVFRQICEAVAYAHKQNVIHRDIKPENILIKDQEFTPIVSDFGICFFLEDGERFTVTDEVVGPRFYIAPELEDGRTELITPASDVYSLGKLLYWLLSNKIFSREKHREDAYNLAKDQIAPDFYIINELLDRMIVSDPQKRFQNASEIITNLDNAIERIRLRAHLIDIDVPQACLYCGTGFYHPVVNDEVLKEAYSRTNVKDFGFTLVDSSMWLILVCDHCGNVQLFRPDYAENKNVWKEGKQE